MCKPREEGSNWFKADKGSIQHCGMMVLEPISRAYYELLLEGGRAVTVFRDEISGGWCEQRYG